MATETAEKIFDMDKMEFVEKPNPEKEASTEKETETEEESEEEEQEEEENKDSETDTEKEAEGETEIEESEDGEGEKEKEEKEAEEQVLTPDDFIKNVFEEKYDIKTQAELEETVDKALDALEELDKVKKENEELKLAKPKFASEQEEKAFNFIKKFDVSRQSEGLETYAKLIGMDVESSDPKLLLEEQFVHQHPEWTRAEAQRMFEKEYRKKYTVNKESFESDAEYQAELQDMETLKKGDVHRAKQYLKEQQEKYKPQAKDTTPSTPEVITKSIEKNTTEYQNFAKGKDEVVFEKAGSKFIFKLDKDKKAAVERAMTAWVKNPQSYNNKGELVGVKNPDEMLRQVVGAVYVNDLVDAIYDQVKNEVSKKRVEEIAKVTPKKRSAPGAGDTPKQNDLYAGAMILINKKKAK